MQDKTFKPYISPDRHMPEFTWVSAILGIILAVVFGAANAYLGLRVGLTVSASIPAAVVSMGVIRGLLRRSSILENNMVQTIGSAGEAVAAGAIFTLPAIFMWAAEGLCSVPSIWEVALIALAGGVLGVLLMIPLRQALIVAEHGILPYPEGKACADVLLAGEKGGGKAGAVFAGLGVSALYKFLADGLRLFPSRITWNIKSYRGAGIGVDVLPALAGVGYICGPRVASYLFSGGILAWLVLMPLLVLFGGDAVIFPASETVQEIYAAEGAHGVWSQFVRYIGAGAVAAGGVISLVRSLPLIASTFLGALRGYGAKGGTARTERSLPLWAVGAGVFAVLLFLWLTPTVPLGFLGALLVVVFAFFFAAVSARMVGLIGSSNNPVSGMAIATLLIASAVLMAAGKTGIYGMLGAIAIGSVICIVCGIAGDGSQDLKTGYLLGATPVKQQLGELLGAAASAAVIGGVLALLHKAWGFGTEQLPAPQATLMKLVVEGVMGGRLPWTLVLSGAFIAAVVEILGIPVLPVAIGLYLPIHLSVPIVIGGLIRHFADKRSPETVENGTLYSSGLIAGEGLVGILLAVFALIPIGSGTLEQRLDLSGTIQIGALGSVVVFSLLVLSLAWYAMRRERSENA